MEERRNTWLATPLNPLVLRFSHCPQAQLGDSRLSPDVGHLVLTTLCPALHALVADGLKPFRKDLITGQRRSSPWSVVEASVKPGEPQGSGIRWERDLNLADPCPCPQVPAHIRWDLCTARSADWPRSVAAAAASTLSSWGSSSECGPSPTALLVLGAPAHHG